MKKNFITGFIAGGIICATVTGIAVEYAVAPNAYPVYVDGQTAEIEGYNINDSTYFKLRDIGDKVGFRVDFANNLILVNTAPLPTATPVPTVAPLSVPLPDVKIEIVDGVEYVRKSNIEKMLDSIGLGDYQFSTTQFFDGSDYSKPSLLTDIPHDVDDASLIPYSYYISSIVPVINSLR